MSPFIGKLLFLKPLVQDSRGLICSHNFSGEIIYSNPAAAESLGYTTQELLGVHLRQLLADKVHSMLDQYLQKIKATGHHSGSTELRRTQRALEEAHEKMRALAMYDSLVQPLVAD